MLRKNSSILCGKTSHLKCLWMLNVPNLCTYMFDCDGLYRRAETSMAHELNWDGSANWLIIYESRNFSRAYHRKVASFECKMNSNGLRLMEFMNASHAKCHNILHSPHSIMNCIDLRALNAPRPAWWDNFCNSTVHIRNHISWNESTHRPRIDERNETETFTGWMHYIARVCKGIVSEFDCSRYRH